MKGTLEVLVVNAKGITHTNLFGTPAYFVTLQCGTLTQKTKVSKVDDGCVCWNERFIFELPLHIWRDTAHLKLTIFDEECFGKHGFVGQIMVHLGGVVSEGIRRGAVEEGPSIHVVVLGDDTYEGQMKIGLKFSTNMGTRRRGRRVLKVKDTAETERELCNHHGHFFRVIAKVLKAMSGFLHSSFKYQPFCNKRN